MRKYQPIWDALKAKKVVSITAPITSHKRIVQAVRKERSNDLAWQYMINDAKKRYELVVTCTGTIIKFELTDRPYIPKLEDL